MPSLRQSYAQIGTTGEHALYPVTPEESKNPPFTFDNLSVHGTREAYEEECKQLGIPSYWNNDGVAPRSDLFREHEEHRTPVKDYGFEW